MTTKPINRKVRGIRDSIPAGYILGRASGGNGPPILLPMSTFTTPGYVAGTTIQVNGPAGGDLTGTYPNPTVAKVQGNAVQSGVPVNGEILRYSSADVQWDLKAEFGDFIIDGTDYYIAAVNSLSDPQAVLASGLPTYVKNPPIPNRGVTDGSDAPAGAVGELIKAVVLSGSAVNLTNNVVSNLTTISLTAGDWDVRGEVAFSAAGTTTTSYCAGGISTTSATFPIIGQGASYQMAASQPAGFDSFFGLTPFRFSITTPTTLYLIAQAGFAVSTLGAYGYIEARRVR